MNLPKNRQSTAMCDITIDVFDEIIILRSVVTDYARAVMFSDGMLMSIKQALQTLMLGRGGNMFKPNAELFGDFGNGVQPVVC